MRKIGIAKLGTTLIFILLTISGCAVNSTESENEKVKLYALNCSTLEISDMGVFSEKGKLDGEKAILANPCFLIRHPKGDLMWDTGYEESLADIPEGVKFMKLFHKKMKIKLTDQLSQIDLKPSDIENIAISHFHDDHSGNANLFAGSTFIANEAEHKFMFSAEARENKAAFDVYSKLENAKTILFQDEKDVFGDGTVIIKSMPGHTVGMSVLLVRLKKTGSVLLSGDLYTHGKARDLGTIPTFNADKKLTAESRKRFETLAKKENARVVIQHEKKDFESLPKFPAFLE